MFCPQTRSRGAWVCGLTPTEVTPPLTQMQVRGAVRPGEPALPGQTSRVLPGRFRYPEWLQAHTCGRRGQRYYARAQRTECTRASSCLPRPCLPGPRQLPVSKFTLFSRPNFLPTSPHASTNKGLANPIHQSTSTTTCKVQ